MKTYRDIICSNYISSDIMIGLQNSGRWRVQLTIAVDFISSKDFKEQRVMHSKSSSTKFMAYDDANENVDEYFESLFQDTNLVQKRHSEIL